MIEKAKRLAGIFSGNKYLIFLLGSLIGFIFFVAIFGLSIINPTNIDWIFAGGGDLAQHYLGWAFFRDSDWSFPLGMIENLAYPFGIPLTFMDAIPLFAVIFKLLSPILPETFQYLGLFTVLSFVLQGGIAALILRRFTSNIIIIAIGVVFFVVSPVVLMRSLAHTALTASWIVLLGIYFVLRFSNKKIEPLPFMATWCLLLVLSVLIHPYFFPMTLALFCISIVKTYHRERVWLTAIRVLTPIIIALSVFGLFGGFMKAGDALNELDLDIYSLNIVSPIDPMGNSAFMSRQAFVDDRQGIPETSEKTAYLGLGVIMLLLVLVYELVRRLSIVGWKNTKSRLRTLVSAKNIAIAVIVIALFIFSLGSHIKIADQVLFTWQLPDAIEKLWLTFRSSARMFWPIYYLIILGILVFFIRRFKGKKAIYLALFLIPVMVIQVLDIRLSSVVRAKKAFAHNITHTQPDASKSIGVRIASDETLCGKKHLISLSPYLYLEEFVDFSKAAVPCDMTMSEGYYAHHYKQQDIREFMAREKAKVLSGEADFKNNLYLTTDEKFANEVDARYDVQKIRNWFVIKE